MDDFKIIDMAGNQETQFTPDTFRRSGFTENAGLTLITNITESNIKDAIKIAESARASSNVTAGIISGNINPLNQNMKRLSDSVDAVILSPGKTEDSSRGIIEAVSDLVTKTGFVNIDIEDVNEILRNAGTVYFGAGTAEDSRTAAKIACEMCGNVSGAKRFLVNITTGTEIMLSDMSDAAHVIEMKADPEAHVIWGHVMDDDLGGNVRVSVLAAMNDKGKL